MSSCVGMPSNAIQHCNFGSHLPGKWDFSSLIAACRAHNWFLNQNRNRSPYRKAKTMEQLSIRSVAILVWVSPPNQLLACVLLDMQNAKLLPDGWPWHCRGNFPVTPYAPNCHFQKFEKDQITTLRICTNRCTGFVIQLLFI